MALDHGKVAGIIRAHDRIVVCQKVGDSSVVKIIELDSYWIITFLRDGNSRVEKYPLLIYLFWLIDKVVSQMESMKA